MNVFACMYVSLHLCSDIYARFLTPNSVKKAYNYYIDVCVCLFIYVCVYVGVCVLVYASMYVCIYVFMYACMFDF